MPTSSCPQVSHLESAAAYIQHAYMVSRSPEPGFVHQGAEHEHLTGGVRASGVEREKAFQRPGRGYCAQIVRSGRHSRSHRQRHDIHGLRWRQVLSSLYAMTVLDANRLSSRLPALCNATLIPRLQWPAVCVSAIAGRNQEALLVKVMSVWEATCPPPQPPACSIFLDIDIPVASCTKSVFVLLIIHRRSRRFS